MLIAILICSAIAAVLPAAVRMIGTRAFYFASATALGLAIYTATFIPVVLSGRETVEKLAWVPSLELSLDMRMDALALVLALVVSIGGTLVLFYCASYFNDREKGLGRFAGNLMAFVAVMYGLVASDNIYALFTFWELTSVFSYLLIGQYTNRAASRSAALQALLVTTLGGLVMLVGLVLLASEAGTTSLEAILAHPPTSAGAVVAVYLVLVGALSKSAIFPFHFWLPGAMAAPTPVSAYLHAAAMVKAGIYLIARLSPAFAEVPGYRETLVILGGVTMLLGGYQALKQTDIKQILAFGTVSQLGFLTIVMSFGSADTLLAGIVLLVAHAAFKCALFLCVGIIDHSAGTRDLRKLSGLGRKMPLVTTVAVISIASMCGIPPLLGYLGKEAALTTVIEQGSEHPVLSLVAVAAIALGSVLTVAYSARFVWGAFAKKPGMAESKVHREGVAFYVSPSILALVTIGLGVAPGVIGSLAEPVSEAAGKPHYHLALWHGIEPALIISALAIALGLVMFWMRDAVSRAQAALPGNGPASAGYFAVIRAVDVAANRTTRATQRGSLPFYLASILVVLVVTVGASLAMHRQWSFGLRLWDYPAQAVIGLLMAVAALAATRARKRFEAVVLTGITGYGIATIFAFSGAPDLALTQVLVETVTLVAFVLVVRRLPPEIGKTQTRARRVGRIVLGVAVGGVMSVAAWVAASSRVATSISAHMPSAAYQGGHGKNTVNVILVDVRGWDTMGELSVLIAAATGVASLIFLSSRVDEAKRSPRVRGFFDRRRLVVDHDSSRYAWLLAGRSLAPGNRSIVLEVVVRLIFHSMLIVSVYLLLVGHNLPGGGFAGGLVAGLAFVARYMAGGREELAAAVRIDAGKLLGLGLLLATGTALAPMLFGHPPLTSSTFEWEIPVLGHIEFVTATVFDIGVYLIVVGLVLDVMRSLGAEVDRQEEDDLESEEETEEVDIAVDEMDAEENHERLRGSVL